MLERLQNQTQTPSDEFLLFFLLISSGLILTYVLYLMSITNFKLFKIKRKTKIENRYSKNMGRLISNVVYIKLYFIGIPIKTIHKYRTTYYGEIKNTDDCDLNK
jgi:hypothetical protein